MSKKLILITVAVLGILYSEGAMAKVCRLGDTSCDTNGFYGVGEGDCDSSYKTCSNPRVGASFCFAEGEAKYRDDDCCATLVANEGYQNCSIDDALVGYGKSCRGAADNITYWQYCGCSYGFVEVDGSNTTDEKELLDGNNEPIKNLDGNLVPYEARCGFDTKLYGGKCRFAQCNTDRRFFFENAGEHCKYREETRCGGFGCMQVYDCNHDELNTGKEYYRNDSAQLATGWDNFIPYLSEDQLTNEKDASGTVQLIRTLNSTGTGLVTEDYNLTNKIVCAYAQSNGTGDDTGTGLSCNDVPNYCYLWTGCNNVRKWYSNHVNEGVIYDSEEAYLKWMEIVERQSGYNYSAVYAKNNPYHDAFYADINPGYGTYTKTGNTYDAVNGSSCIKGVGCRITSANNGCTYITTNCHQDDAQHQCWKKISCSEENRFYSSFINASNVDNKTGKQELYLSSLNAPYWDEFYAGLQDKEIYPACLYEINECNDASGCYKKIGCETGFEDIRDHEEIENDWYLWFGDIRALCNDATRCYRATSCEASVGAYSSRPNTSFFVTISSTATGLTCFRGQECYLEAGAYTSVPNTSFFVTINSLASGSTCYRGQNCYIAGGAYSSSPNTQWFFVESSIASGSTCYRGQGCKDLENGAYSSEPNTSFFYTINSFASGSGCYRGSSCNIEAGAYSSTPNTSFFITISSSATGSTAYRGEESHIAAGAYSSAPNTSFFNTIKSLASGSTSYRGESTSTAAGAYTSTPNTSFFYVIKSSASGSTSYRGQESHIKAGAYSSAPNTSFFITISSLASGSTSYRGEMICEDCGAYSSTPNTSFFYVINSLASGSTAYRGQESHIKAGAYSSAPNTSFFITISSLASGSTSYRGEKSHIAAGAYSSTPNTSYFIVISSQASGSISYRAERANPDGAYTSRPNTSFFLYGGSHGSGSIAYRGSGVHTEAGAYATSPNTSFFHVIYSLASGSTSYRADRAHIEVGAYSSTPNTSFFSVIKSLASGSTSYRAESAGVIIGAYSSTPNTSFFITVKSLGSGSTAYRATVANTAAGAYTSTPNETYFVVHKSLASGSTCYRGAKCADSSAAITNTSFFITTKSLASGSTCYRAQGGCCFGCGAYSSAPNSSFFNVLTSTNAKSDSTCYRGGSCATSRGAYSSYPNTSFFYTVRSFASGSTCYRASGSSTSTACRFNAGVYASRPNTAFFVTISSSASGIVCYRGQNCATAAGSYVSTPNTSFFNTLHSLASGSKCYRASGSTTSTACRFNAGAYASSPNTAFFDTIKSSASGITCYRGQNCAFTRGAYASTPNTKFFHTSDSYASGSRCFRATGCVYTPNQYVFNRVSSSGSGITCYRASTCRADTVAESNKPNSQYFNRTTSTSNGVTCYYATSEKCTNSDTTRFTYDSKSTDVTSDGRTEIAYYPTGCRGSGYACSTTPGSYFNGSGSSYTTTSTSGCGHSKTCYVPTKSSSTCKYASSCSSSFYCDSQSWCGQTCYKSTSCNTGNDYVSSSGKSIYYNYRTAGTTDTGTQCYYATSCKIPGYSSSQCSSTYFSNTSGISAGSEGSAYNCCTKTASVNDCYIKDKYDYYSYSTTATATCCGTSAYKITGCAGSGSYNNSYADSNISYSYRKGSTTSTKSYSYGTAFTEKTTSGEGIACSSYANCYVGCSCQSGWTQGPVPSSGEYVWATDAYYTGVNAMSVSNVSDVNSLTEGKSTQSTSGNTQVVSLSGGVSTMGSSGGITCYKAACSSGYYLDAPNSTYFTSTSTTGTIGLTCYKATGCKDGYAEDGDTSGPGATYHGMKCYPIENATGWSMTQTFMNLDEKNGCYKPISCKSGYHDYSEMKSNFTDYFYVGAGVEFGGLNCLAGSCKTSPNTSYFTTSDYDIGDGTKCKYVTGCNYNYSSSPDTSGCINTSPVATSGNIKCYERGSYNGIYTVTLVIDHYYKSYTKTHDYTIYGLKLSCPSSERVAVSISTGKGSYSTSSTGPQCGTYTSILTQVDGIVYGSITSAKPEMASSSVGHCSIFTEVYNEGTPGEFSYPRLMKFDYENNVYK